MSPAVDYDYTVKYLILVDGVGANHNKYYRMIPQGDVFQVEYGRVGASAQTRQYPISQWEKKYNEKVRKGYVDQSHLVQDLIQKQKPKADNQYKKIDNPDIEEIVELLMSYAKQKVAANYRVSSNQVTQAMVDEAQKIIDKLMMSEDIVDFNSLLSTLFTVIPRRMGNVKEYLAKSKEDFPKILKDEQDLLDVMRGQVVTHVVEEEEQEEESPLSNKTILEAMGLIFEPVDAGEIAMIKSKLGDVRDRYFKAWRVRNLRTQKRYDNFCAKEHITEHKLLWHGSRNENWWSIINNGLMIRPTNAVYTGSMFGDAIYSAPKARKSLGYTSLSGSYWARGNSNKGFMALMSFAYGTPYNIYSFNGRYYGYNYKKLQQDCPGANCLHAHAGASIRNDEIVFYNTEQCTIQYLVELR